MSRKTIQVCVPKGGPLRYVYADDFDLSRREGANLRRASTVEPVRCPELDPNRWFWQVDLRPVGGPVTVCRDDGLPFETREQAIQWEVDWLEANLNRLDVNGLLASPSVLGG